MKNRFIALLALASLLLNGVSAQAETLPSDIAIDILENVTPGLISETAAESQTSINELETSGSALLQSTVRCRW